MGLFHCSSEQRPTQSLLVCSMTSDLFYGICRFRGWQTGKTGIISVATYQLKHSHDQNSPFLEKNTRIIIDAGHPKTIQP